MASMAWRLVARAKCEGYRSFKLRAGTLGIYRDSLRRTRCAGDARGGKRGEGGKKTRVVRGREKQRQQGYGVRIGRYITKNSCADCVQK